MRSFSPRARLALFILLLAGRLPGSTDARPRLLDRLSAPPDEHTRRESFTATSGRRTYWIREPVGIPRDRPRPLLILFHGGGGNARQALNSYPLAGVAQREGTILVAPDGTGRSRLPFLLTWNVGFGFGQAREQEVDEVLFAREFLAHLESTTAIDPDRIFLTGLSNGAMLCHRLGAALSDRIAGIAPVVGTAAGRRKDQAALSWPVAPAHPLAVILFNGALDDHVPLDGGWQRKSIGEPVEMASARASAEFWVKANGCDPEPEITEDPDRKITRYRWSGGRKGTDVVLVVHHDQGHAWPGGAAPSRRSDAPTTRANAHEMLFTFFRGRRRTAGTPPR